MEAARELLKPRKFLHKRIDEQFHPYFPHPVAVLADGFSHFLIDFDPLDPVESTIKSARKFVEWNLLGAVPRSLEKLRRR